MAAAARSVRSARLPSSCPARAAQARFTAFLDIAAHKDHLSYQTYQAMIALAQGGLAGAGVGQGKNKLGDFLPLAHSDFIFAVVAEELGFIGVVAVLGGFLILAYVGVQVALGHARPIRQAARRRHRRSGSSCRRSSTSAASPG